MVQACSSHALAILTKKLFDSIEHTYHISTLMSSSLWYGQRKGWTFLTKQLLVEEWKGEEFYWSSGSFRGHTRTI